MKARLESTGKSYSDHEALEANLEIEIGENSQGHGLCWTEGQPASGQLMRSANHFLQSEMRNCIEEEIQSSKRWSYFHLLFGLCFLPLAFVWMASLSTTFSICASLTLFAFHLVMLSIYLERQCSLKAISQDLFWPSRPL